MPPGYHVEEKPRSGLVTAGIIVTAIPYSFSVMGALEANFRNESVWLVVPFAGPWLTMGRRSYGCDKVNEQNKSAKESLQCVGDVFLVMALITDGIIQTTGGALLLAGYVATKPTLVRDGPAFRIAPTRVGSGYGVGVVGAF